MDVLKSADLQKKFEENGVTRMALGPRDFAAFLRREEAKFSAVVARGKISAE